MQQRITSATMPILVCIVVFGVHRLSPVDQTGGDTYWSVPMAVSLLHEGNLALDEYAPLATAVDPRIVRVHGEHYSIFPIGGPLLITPIVWAYDQFYDLTPQVMAMVSTDIERTAAAIVVALAALLLYQLGRLGDTRLHPLLIVFLFAFCTPAWSTASRALWQHGPSILMLSTTLYLLLCGQHQAWAIPLASLPLAFSYVVRPTNSLSILFLSLFVLLRYPRSFWLFIGGGLLVALPFLTYNWTVYHWILPPYYAPQRIGSHAHFVSALLGNLVSPSRGLLLYLPITLLALAGTALRFPVWRGRSLEKKESSIGPNDSLLTLILWSIILTHWLVISTFAHWWGGYSYGPRFFTDMVPYIIWLSVPAVERLPMAIWHPRSWRKIQWSQAAIVFCMMLSFLIHARGATGPATWAWNWQPVGIDAMPQRLWDWFDAQALRGLAWGDRFIPTKLMTDPTQIFVLRTHQEVRAREVTLSLFDVRNRAFDWQAQASTGLVLETTSGTAQPRTALHVTVPTAGQSRSQGTIGEIRITTHPKHRFDHSRVTVIPVIVIEDAQQIFLPMIQNQ